MTSINKPAGQWTDEELLSWSRGETSPSGQASNRTVTNECVSRFGFEANDDIDTIKALVIAKFATTGEVLEKDLEAGEEGGEDGGAIGDEVKEDEPVVGEADTSSENPPAPSEAPTAPAPETVEETSTTQEVVGGDEPEMPEETFLVKHTPVIPKQADMSREIIESNLASYAKTMAPNCPVSPEQAATKQLSLYRTFQVVLRSNGTDFFKNMDLLLGFIAANRTTLFTESRAYRSMDQVRLPGNERKNFERLLNLFIGTAARDTRALALKQVDLARSMVGLDAETQQRLTEYYSV